MVATRPVTTSVVAKGTRRDGWLTLYMAEYAEKLVSDTDLEWCQANSSQWLGRFESDVFLFVFFIRFVQFTNTSLVRLFIFYYYTYPCLISGFCEKGFAGKEECIENGGESCPEMISMERVHNQLVS